MLIKLPFTLLPRVLLFWIFFTSIAYASLNLELPDFDLPEFGNSTATASQDSSLGLKVLRNFRKRLPVVEDPELSSWIQAMGNRLASKAPSHGKLYFLLLKDPDVNAFSSLGGVIVIITGLVLVADHLSKWCAQSRLETGICSPETCIGVFGTRLRFHLVHNTGAAFSLGEGLGWLIAPLAFLMAGALLLVARQTSDRVSLVALGLVIGGALGNMVDRVIRAEEGLFSGGVVDFIDFQFWPVFNVADMAVVGGVVLLLIRQMGQPDEVAADEGTVDG